VLIRLRMRRFCRHHPACHARTFAEQVPGLTTPYARRSPLARRLLEWDDLVATSNGRHPATEP
jgi:hypothetical protein